jgi:hypothetical protein
MRRLAERDPDNTGWLRDLSMSHYLISSILEKQGRLTEALEEREAGLGIAERLARLDSTNKQWQDDLKASQDALEALKNRITNPGNWGKRLIRAVCRLFAGQ